MSGIRVKQITARPASRLNKAHAHRYAGCVQTDGTAMYGRAVQGKRRKAPWSEEHIALAKQLGVSPKALQAEISKARKRERKARGE